MVTHAAQKTPATPSQSRCNEGYGFGGNSSFIFERYSGNKALPCLGWTRNRREGLYESRYKFQAEA